MGMETILHHVMWLEYLGTVAFAASGALVGLKKKMDIFGVMVLGLTTAVGGGALRDVLLGVTPPQMFRNPVYAIVAMVAALLLFMKPVRKLAHTDSPAYDRIMFLADTLGLAIFTVVGVRTAREVCPEGGLFLQVFVGAVSAVGGGVLRDVMAGEPPYIFTKHIYAVASVAGALVCAILWDANQIAAMAVGFVLVVVIRCLASHYRWNLPR